MCDAAHGVKWLATAALGISLVALDPTFARADSPGHSLADRFATDAEKAEQRKQQADRVRREAERARREADRRKSEEADMLGRARAEAEQRRAEQERSRAEAEAAEAERIAAEQRRTAEIEAERLRREAQAVDAARRQAEAENARRLAEAEAQRIAQEQRAAEQRRAEEIARQEEQRRAAQAAEAERRRVAEAERAAAEAAREAETRRLAEIEQRAAEERRAGQAAEQEQRAAMAAEREAEASRISEALRAAEAHRAARERAREAARTAPPAAETSRTAELPPQPGADQGAAPSPAGLGAPVLPAGERYAVLLLMEPGSRGIRRHNKTADPVLCGSEGCFVSSGPVDAARQMRPHKALGFFRTLGERAGACSNSLGCVFRNVDLGGLPAWLQPVDMRVIKHDRRQGLEVTAPSQCWLEHRRLQCRGYNGGNYLMWVVPERVAAEAGPELMERALEEGLPEPSQASLR